MLLGLNFYFGGHKNKTQTCNCMKKMFTLLAITAGFSVSWAQQATLKGTVISGEDQTPVPFANIAVTGTSGGGTTDLNGKFELKLNAGSYTLKISSLGFANKEEKVTLAAGETKSISITLPKSAVDLAMFTKTEGKYEKKVEELTVSLDIIKPNIIENKNATSADQALQQTPGLVIVDSEPQLRGGSGYSFGAGSRVMVLVDDLPLLSGDAGRPSWGFIPVENIEQIEVVKGAASVLYGSGALAGVINIRSAFPTNTPKTKVTFFGGVYNIRKKNRWHDASSQPFNTGLSFLHSRKLGKNKEFDLVLGGNLFKEKGFIGPARKDTLGFLNSTNSGEFETRGRFNFNFRHRVHKVEGLAWGLNGNIMYAQSAGSFIWDGASADSVYRSQPGTTTRTLQTTFHLDPYVTYQHKSGTTHSLRMRYFYLDNNNSNNQGNSSQLFFGEYQTRIVFPKIADFSITPGVMATYTMGKAQLFAGQPPIPVNPYDSVRTDKIGTDNTNVAFYTQIEKKFFKRLTLSGGFRVEYFRIGKYDRYTLVDNQGTVPDQRLDTNFVTTNIQPVFRLGINFKAAEETYLRASFGQGFRFPTIAERFVKTTVGPAQVYPNPVLEPEKSYNVELGIKQGIKIGQFMGYIDLAGFYQRFNNTIEFTFAQWGKITDPLFGLGFRSVNIGRSQVWGLDFSVMGQGKFTKDLTMNVLMGYTYTNPRVLDPNFAYQTLVPIPGDTVLMTNRNTSDTINNPKGDLLKYRFEHLVRADVEFIYKKLMIGVSFRYNSMMRNIDNAFYKFESLGVVNGVGRSRNPKGDYVFDMRIGYEVHKGHRVNFIVNNLLNRVYALRPLAPEAPRYFALQYQVQF